MCINIIQLSIIYVSRESKYIMTLSMAKKNFKSFWYTGKVNHQMSQYSQHYT